MRAILRSTQCERTRQRNRVETMCEEMYLKIRVWMRPVLTSYYTQFCLHLLATITENWKTSGIEAIRL